MKSLSSSIVAVAGSIILYTTGTSSHYADFLIWFGALVVLVGVGGVYYSKDK